MSICMNSTKSREASQMFGKKKAAVTCRIRSRSVVFCCQEFERAVKISLRHSSRGFPAAGWAM